MGEVIHFAAARARLIAAGRLVRPALADVCPHCGEAVATRSFAAQRSPGAPVYHGACFWAAHMESER